MVIFLQPLQNTGDSAAFPGTAILGAPEIFVKAIHRHNTAPLLPLLFNSDFANIAAVSNKYLYVIFLSGNENVGIKREHTGIYRQISCLY